MEKLLSASTKVDGMSCYATLNEKSSLWHATSGCALAPWDVMGGGKFKTKKEIEERKAQGEDLRSILSRGQSEEEAAMSAAH